MNTQQTPACRLELPQYYFVDVFEITPQMRKEAILSRFSVGDIQNQVTLASVSEALENADVQLTK